MTSYAGQVYGWSIMFGGIYVLHFYPIFESSGSSFRQEELQQPING